MPAVSFDKQNWQPNSVLLLRRRRRRLHYLDCSWSIGDAYTVVDAYQIHARYHLILDVMIPTIPNTTISMGGPFSVFLSSYRV